MNVEPTDPSLNVEFFLHLDSRPLGTIHAIHAIGRYLELMEDQMPGIQEREMASLRAERPLGDEEEEEQAIYFDQVNYLEQLFEEELFPTDALFIHRPTPHRFRGAAAFVLRCSAT